ncbi:hypothetical protein Pmani_029502 [Petrolisthes manimaculis]|uniref:Uncharacterized protein n=1 Tax=Petrolisthes manimaculis TaxID=1843537 RepID=A0AAE1TUK0_9EUCA|nr:hypothetical protein Pmani_029502 [Petrolisthes manimaculis]
MIRNYSQLSLCPSHTTTTIITDQTPTTLTLTSTSPTIPTHTTTTTIITDQTPTIHILTPTLHFTPTPRSTFTPHPTSAPIPRPHPSTHLYPNSSPPPLSLMSIPTLPMNFLLISGPPLLYLTPHLLLISQHPILTQLLSLMHLRISLPRPTPS